jgi:hypothetical protein
MRSFGPDSTTADLREGIDLTAKVARVAGGSGGLGEETAPASAAAVLTERIRTWRGRVLAGACMLVICCGLHSGAAAQSTEDASFIRGYVSAILQHELKMARPTVTVEGRAITIVGDMSDTDREMLRAILAEHGHGDYRLVVKDTSWVEAFPGPSIFLPLVADPRWPHFSAAYDYYLGDKALTHAVNVSFGESFPLVRFHLNSTSDIDLAIQAGVFAVFDLGSNSFDLLNADYTVGLPIAYRNGRFSALLRAFHQSSHLGDEFLLRHSHPDRVNLSYEEIDVLGSYEWPWGFRTYAGAGYIVHYEPHLEPITTQGGIEWLGAEEPRLQLMTQRIAPLSRFRVRPIAAVDVKFREEGGWAGDYSPRIGLQLSSGNTRTVELLLEYFHGKSPNGQFYVNHVEYVGFGGHLHF